MSVRRVMLNGLLAEDAEVAARRWGATPLLGARSTQQGVGTDTYLVAPGAGETRDELTVSGAWLASRDPVDLGVWR